MTFHLQTALRRAAFGFTFFASATLSACGGGGDAGSGTENPPFSAFAGSYSMKLSGASSMTPECASNSQCHKGTVQMTIDADGVVRAQVAYETVAPYKGGDGQFVGQLNQDGSVDVKSVAYSGPAECETRPEGAAYLRLWLNAGKLSASTGAWASPGFAPKATPESLSDYCQKEVGTYPALGPLEFVSTPVR